MNKEKATEFVVKELGKHHNRNDIIVTLCEQMKLNWREAELLVQEIESQQGRAIAIRQSPIIIVLGVGILLAGIWITFSNFLFFVGFFQSQHDTFSVMGTLELRALTIRAGSLISGLAMIAGGVIGSWKFFYRLLNG